jgi:N-acetylneuraminate synthase
MFGPDVPASLTVEELTEVRRGMDAISQMLRHPIDKDAAAGEMSQMRRLFTRSLVLRADLPAGHALSREDLMSKKPGSGIPPAQIDTVLGRRLVIDVRADELLAEGMLEPAASQGQAS